MELATLIRRMLPESVTGWVRVGRVGARAAWERLHSVDGRGFARALRRVGVRPGSVLFVHSAYDQMTSVRCAPLEVIRILGEAVGEAGTVVMPTFPMAGRSQDHLDSGAVFDVRRTPSRAGLLTEVFRRMPGAVRSLHPTHPVSARGPAAERITLGHERSATPFDEHSPFQRMLDAGADVLGIGTLSAMTFRHLADHQIQDRLPYPIYSGCPTAARVVDRDGTTREILTQGHNPRLGCEHAAVLDRMARAGRLRRGYAGRVPMFLVSVAEYVATYHRAQADGLVRYTIDRESDDA